MSKDSIMALFAQAPPQALPQQQQLGGAAAQLSGLFSGQPQQQQQHLFQNGTGDRETGMSRKYLGWPEKMNLFTKRKRLADDKTVQYYNCSGSSL